MTCIDPLVLLKWWNVTRRLSVNTNYYNVSVALQHVSMKMLRCALQWTRYSALQKHPLSTPMLFLPLNPIYGREFTVMNFCFILLTLLSLYYYRCNNYVARKVWFCVSSWTWRHRHSHLNCLITQGSTLDWGNCLLCVLLVSCDNWMENFCVVYQQLLKTANRKQQNTSIAF